MTKLFSALRRSVWTALHHTPTHGQTIYVSRASSSQHSLTSTRAFSTTPPQYSESKNRIYTNIRDPASLHETVLLSTSSRIPLLTYWSASYCPPCKVISPLLKKIVNSTSPPCPAEPANKIGFAEVEFDANDIMMSSVPMDFMVNSLPTLIVFDRGEVVERVTDVRNMSNEQWLRDWIEVQARRKGEGSGGSGKGVFGGLFSKL